MKLIVTILLLSITSANTQAQILKKLKEKAEQAAGKIKDKLDEKKPSEENVQDGKPTEAGQNKSTNTNTSGPAPDLKVYSKFDFVPGSTILYFDNFEKDNIGETPMGWITSNSAEVVTIDGLEATGLRWHQPAQGILPAIKNKPGVTTLQWSLIY